MSQKMDHCHTRIMWGAITELSGALRSELCVCVCVCVCPHISEHLRQNIPGLSHTPVVRFKNVHWHLL